MHIVFVEDNLVIAKSINKVLEFEGYATTHFTDGAVAKTWLIDNANAYDLIMLDVLLPGIDGFSLSKELRLAGISSPILLLTSKSTLEDTVEGLDCGADDYVRKPFEFDELLARVRSLLRRKDEIVRSVVTINQFVTVDLLAQRAFKEGKDVHLTSKEFRILEYFLHNPNILMSQQQLYDHVFDFAEVQLSNTIEVHVKNLRKKLRAGDTEIPLTTIRNAGYRYDYEG